MLGAAAHVAVKYVRDIAAHTNGLRERFGDHKSAVEYFFEECFPMLLVETWTWVREQAEREDERMSAHERTKQLELRDVLAGLQVLSTDSLGQSERLRSSSDQHEPVADDGVLHAE